MRLGSCCLLCSFLLFECIAPQLVWSQESHRTTQRSLDPEVEVLVAGYRANRERIQFASAELKKSMYHARSVEDALAQRWLIDEPRILKGRWVSDGQLIRSEITFPMENAHFVVRNKHFEIRKSAGSSQITVTRVGREIGNPWSQFLEGQRMCYSSRIDAVEFHGKRKVDGKELIAIGSPLNSSRFEDALGKFYFINPDRGFFPERVEERPTPGLATVFNICTDYLQSHGGWAPRHWFRIVQGGVCTVTEEEVTEWNDQDRPNPSVFRVAVSPGEILSFDPTIPDSRMYQSFEAIFGEEIDRLDSNSLVNKTKRKFRVRGTEIDLAWFKEDGSLTAPDGALELVEEAKNVDFPSSHPAHIPDENPPLEIWQFAAVLAICVSMGFGFLFLLDWIRRIRTAKRQNSQRTASSEGVDGEQGQS